MAIAASASPAVTIKTRIKTMTAVITAASRAW